MIYFDGNPAEKKCQNKNILRNFGNAQNNYILNNTRPRAKINARLEHPEAFDKWVRSLNLSNFAHFKEIWHPVKAARDKTFRKLYQELCWDFYEE